MREDGLSIQCRHSTWQDVPNESSKSNVSEAIRFGQPLQKDKNRRGPACGLEGAVNGHVCGQCVCGLYSGVAARKFGGCKLVFKRLPPTPRCMMYDVCTVQLHGQRYDHALGLFRREITVISIQTDSLVLWGPNVENRGRRRQPRFQGFRSTYRCFFFVTSVFFQHAGELGATCIRNLSGIRDPCELPTSHCFTNEHTHANRPYPDLRAALGPNIDTTHCGHQTGRSRIGLGSPSRAHAPDHCIQSDTPTTLAGPARAGQSFRRPA